MTEDRFWHLFAKVSDDLLIASAALALTVGFGEGLWSDERLRPTLRVIVESGYEWAEILLIWATIFLTWIFTVKSKPLNPVRIRIHLAIILAEYLLVFLITVLWGHFHDQQGYLIGALYIMYLLGNLLVLKASSVQMALLTWVALGRVPQLPSTWLRVLLSVMAFFCGEALAFLFQWTLGWAFSS